MPKQVGPVDTVLVPILMLLVFSASVTGGLIFGRPVLWYLDGKKKETFSLLITTLLIFLGFIGVAVLALVFYFVK